MMNNWIDIKDILPESQDIFLCVVDDFGIKTIEVLRYNDGYFYNDNHKKQNATHWMDLPKLPE